MSTTPLLTVESLSYHHPGNDTPVFADLEFAVADGEFVAIVGGSGVGKSTLLRNIAGLIPPSAGRITLSPANNRGSRDRGFVFQDTRLLPWRRIASNIEYGLAGLDLSRAERHQRIDEVLELTAMTPYRDRWPHSISGGQAQRIGLARALAVHPRLLLMDEPFSAVDALTRRHLQDELLAIWRRLGMAVLFVTHDIDEALYLADRIQVMRGSPAAIVRDERIDLPRPRERGDNAFVALTHKIADSL
ncbi:ABC transporter ATP-binding protein [Salinisphaera sp. LB1]|uniref:ABC transporter ATP-binding protein n=1 Tax=Salinisphaera sp. LB1 TaxID=2183911 RepID=UPI000D7050E3|nr:ABC transporter ATP-binding protein [Salinisphaera sp. LB1]